MTAPLDVLRTVLARVVLVREAIEDGDSAYVRELTADLEDDLAGWLAAFPIYVPHGNCADQSEREILERIASGVA